MNAPPKPAPCWACGGRGRSGPRNEVCHCQEPKAPAPMLNYTCPACYGIWATALGTHICPSCGYDRVAYKRHKFAAAHREIRKIVQGGGSMPPERGT